MYKVYNFLINREAAAAYAAGRIPTSRPLEWLPFRR
jgi:hypothetical protein